MVVQLRAGVKLHSLAAVEANVTMETLVKAVQPLHLTPTVVAESKSTTVADAFAATTNASSSSRYGTFDCTVMTAGVVLGNGHFVSSSINDPDRGELLQRSAGAFHSLGITTMLEIALVKAGPYVEVTYTPVSSISEMVKRIVVAASQSAELESSIDFVEGILLDRCKGMIVTGRRVLNAHRKLSQALATGKDFTEHVRSICRRHRGSSELVVELYPVDQYLFRHDQRRSVQQVRNKRFSWPASKHALDTAAKGAAKFLDFAVSRSSAEEIVTLLTAEYNSWPIWICPVMSPKCFGRSETFSLEPAASELLLNIGMWDSASVRDGSIDVRLHHKDSFRYLRSRAPCSPETLWFDHDDRRYAWLRSQWKADTFASIADRLQMPNPFQCADTFRRHTWAS
ncbi:hypothetical protein BKA63DRAFT_430233 [Paraphoma chrysanthemicola]|nr:hypothetical protein BKA63DRAFT_430233 [Paraphoma chrysanthemicola]